MSNRKRAVRSIIRIAVSNFSTIVSGVLIGFILPKVLAVSDYGLYKTFSLYITYAGLFGLGITDGILLYHGGDDYSALDRPRLRAVYRALLIIVAFFGAVIGLLGMFSADGDMSFIFVMVGIDLIAINSSNYFRNISQVTQRFKEYSHRTVLQSALKSVAAALVAVLSWIGYEISYHLYVTLIVLVDYILVIWYVITYRDIVLGKAPSVWKIRHQVTDLVKQGFPLLAANLTMVFIMAIDRQFVSILFPREAYATYAFAYNLLSLITVAVSAVSTVLYPMLKRTDQERLSDQYSILTSALLVFVFGALMVFFPLSWFIEWFLPDYAASIRIFRIIFPGLAVSSTISTVIHNYYKTFNCSNLFFKTSVWILIISAVFDFIAYRVWGTMESISAASVVCLLIWYLLSDRYFIKKFKYKAIYNQGYIVAATLGFYLFSGCDGRLTGFGCYLVFYMVITVLFFRKYILGFVKSKLSSKEAGE